MRVTLKEAHCYSEAALKAATGVKYETTVTLSIYSPELADPAQPHEAADRLATAGQKLIEQHDLVVALIAASYTIRGQLAEPNMHLGISANLTRKAQLAAEESRLRALLTATESPLRAAPEASVTVALTKAAAMRAQPKDAYLGERDTVTVALLSADDIAVLRQGMKKYSVYERGRINIALTAANVGNSITLDPTTVATLRRAELLPFE